MAQKVLIIDDDPVARRVFHTALSQSGYETAMASDAMVALTEARKYKPDLIILDLGLPAGGGFTFLERLRQFPGLAAIPVVVVSGQSRETNEPRARQAGVAEYIEKPVAPEDLVAAVKRVLGPE